MSPNVVNSPVFIGASLKYMFIVVTGTGFSGPLQLSPAVNGNINIYIFYFRI